MVVEQGASEHASRKEREEQEQSPAIQAEWREPKLLIIFEMDGMAHEERDAAMD